MMTFRWSWIFILYSLLVRLGSATVPVDNHIVDDIHQRAAAFDSSHIFGFLTPNSPPSKPNIGAIVGGVILGLVILLALIGWHFISRNRRIAHVEEGKISPGAIKERPDGVLPDLKSQFSPDESKGRFDRIRQALGRRPFKRSQQSILPVFQIAIPPGSTESINRPPPAAPNHVPRYPSTLERGYDKGSRRPTPPSMAGYPDLPRTASVTTTDTWEPGDPRRKVQVPPKAVLVPMPGRPLPGLAAAVSARSPGLRPPRSPSRRRSWFSKHPFKHPFIPVRAADNLLRFPPGSPLNPNTPAQYHPSRQHLGAQMSETQSPRIEGSPVSGWRMSANPVPPVQEERQVRRPPPAPLEPENLGLSRQERMNAVPGTRSARTHTRDGSRTAIPPNSSRHPLGSSRFLPEPPTTSYI